MNSEALDPRPWSASRWWMAIGAVFTVQVLLVARLEDRRPVVVRRPDAAPAFRLSDGRTDEWLAIEDPTLFAMPHRHGFSGEAWLNLRPPLFESASSPELPHYLSLDPAQLGSAFLGFARTNATASVPAIAVLKPATAVWEKFPIAPPPARSRVVVEGDLASRRMLSPTSLPAMTAPDLLTNSVVQVLVDARGLVLSAVLLSRGNVGNEEADRRALELARTARFESLREATTDPDGLSAGVTSGTLIFEWQTTLAPGVTAPAASP